MPEALRAVLNANGSSPSDRCPGALFSGLATPVEAAAITALYAFAIEMIMHRDLDMAWDAARYGRMRPDGGAFF
jgi:hypothetical protein